MRRAFCQDLSVNGRYDRHPHQLSGNGRGLWCSYAMLLRDTVRYASPHPDEADAKSVRYKYPQSRPGHVWTAEPKQNRQYNCR